MSQPDVLAMYLFRDLFWYRSRRGRETVNELYGMFGRVTFRVSLDSLGSALPGWKVTCQSPDWAHFVTK